MATFPYFGGFGGFPTDPFLDPLVGAFGYDPFAPSYLPGTQVGQRRRVGEPALEQGLVPPGVTGRPPYTVGSAGFTRSIPVDFIERDDCYLVRADIPGVKKSEIHVEVHDKNVLRFGHNPGAERQKEDEEEPGVFHRAERVSTFRNRNLRMPENADMDAELKATYEDGVLEIKVPKKEPGKEISTTTKSIAIE